MTQFLGPDFLLDTPAAQRLYHEVAADLPIVDYHNHLPPAEIAQDHHWDNLGQLWLAHDHYKWRVMRWAGIPEDLCTGPADDRQKFDAFARAMPALVMNPVHHWSHLELWRFFGLDGTVLSPQTADHVWNVANAALPGPEFGARGLLAQMKVRFVGTTDDPLDDLSHHRAMQGDPDLVVAPSFRPDRAFAVESPDFVPWINRLSRLTDISIDGFAPLMQALIQRLDMFVDHGCRAADHGIERLEAGPEWPEARLDAALRRCLSGEAPTADEAAAIRSALFVALGRAYAERDIVMQLHIAPLRNNRSRLLDRAGRDAGADSMNDFGIAQPLNTLLDRLDRTDQLPEMVLYSVNPAHNAVLATTAGNFQDGSRAGKIQVGTAWWFNDQLDGMERQMTDLAQMGLISTFLGMLTDSRSFLSFTRHEYFRRLLCRMLGRQMRDGLIPNDEAAQNQLVHDICWGNAARRFLRGSAVSCR
ncbi:glucuronate isomerase [Paracoccus sp. R12_1]|uniref:glucuronate isomerase n=1 Tax=unclassified Paracoccus (in: a-proteobacteria) TaxID=2688777 RepID=UPI001ADCF713|nr:MULTISPECIES: glucuronate isomerase [unclassified Paracoccus (in: a-proteobacteria)]MBO9456984.1 glucuronate isomerase [Paracoccus sp. R12_2]MBO9488077.1 glucuronate isomerase [Paracoccus sp. R12_1]